MSDIPSLSGIEVLRALERRGFGVSQIKCSYHVVSIPTVGTAVPVHRGQDIDSSLVRKLLKEAGLSVSELLALLRG